MLRYREKVVDRKILKISQPAGFEPARGNPIGFQVQRLNHSATTAVINPAELHNGQENTLDPGRSKNLWKPCGNKSSQPA